MRAWLSSRFPTFLIAGKADSDQPNSVTAPPPVHLANISTRLAVGTGDNVLIAGFIITGTQPKKVIVRGLGPLLPVSENWLTPPCNCTTPPAR